MSSISKYKSLKNDGTWVDCLKYVLSLTDKSEIENHLKQSLTTSYDDLRMFILLSKTTKNKNNLLEIFKIDSLPTKQRAYVGKSWIKLQKDPKEIENFVIESINDKNLPRYLKHQLLKYLHQISHLKRSSFLYDLVCRLTETNNHEEYNIDAHLVPFCKKEQIFDLLSRWSIKRLEQIDSSSRFYSRLFQYQPSIIIHLIQEDLKEKKQTNYEKFSNYFNENERLIKFIKKKEPKGLICLVIDYLKQIEKSQRFAPLAILLKQKYFFEKAPDEMIELITVVASNQPGSIKYKAGERSEPSELHSFEFPHSFSVDNYVRLFFSLYETCNWSSNHTISLLQYMFADTDVNSNLSSIKKRRKWFFDIVVQERIGKDLFVKKLLKEGNNDTLKLLDGYSELTTPLSLHLLSKYEREGIVKAPQRLSLIRYQTMTNELFDEFLSLFTQTGSDVNQRQKNYPLLFQCALSTNEEYVNNVLQWIEKRFTNEQLIVIEHFLHRLSSSNSQFHLEILPNNFQLIESIMDIAINHLQRSTNTLRIINSYGMLLLQQSKQLKNKEEKDQIQAFATKIIKKCYSIDDCILFSCPRRLESSLKTHDIILDILITDVFPKLISKCSINELNDVLSLWNKSSCCIPALDSFLNSFFTKSLLSSSKLQSSFQIDTHSSMISLYLKNKSTQFERVNYLINQIDKTFFIDKNVQRILLYSQQHRQLIDQLIEDDKCVTLDKLSNEQSKFAATLNSTRKKLKLPGLDMDILRLYSKLLTGKQQEHITNIILNDYLQDSEVPNLDKLKSLRVLRRLRHAYNQILQWFDEKQGSPLVVKQSNEERPRFSRDPSMESLDNIILCLPSTFDLTPQSLLKHSELLKTKLNAKNAQYISNAMLSISRKIPDEIFFKYILEFIQDEQFFKFGITANKEILRLLNQYVYDSSLIKNLLKPLWDSHPHQDVRACLIVTILHFLVKSNSNDDQRILWEILEEATNDDYLPVIQSLFSVDRRESRWPLTQLKNSSDPLFERFVNTIQFKVLDHPKSLEARSWAWSSIDYECCDTNQLIEKAQQLCIQFDKEGNQLWENAFQNIMSLYKLNKISSTDIIIDIIQKIMSLREEIDSKENNYDLPVYDRIRCLLTNLNYQINELNNDKKISFRCLTPIILQFDKALAPQIGTLLIKISQNKEDLEDVLKVLQENLTENYFQRILTQLSRVIIERNSCPFIQQLNVDEKLQLAQWFIKEKNRPLFVFDLLKNHVFNQDGIDQELCQNLLRQFRQNEDLYLRQQAMEYTSMPIGTTFGMRGVHFKRSARGRYMYSTRNAPYQLAVRMLNPYLPRWTVPRNEDETVVDNDDDQMSVSDERLSSDLS